MMKLEIVSETSLIGYRGLYIG